MQFPFNPNTNSRQPNLGVYFAPLSASSPYAADPRRGDLHSALSPLYASENPQFRSRQRRPRRALEPLSGGRRAQRRFLNSILASDREDNDDGFMSASEAELDEEDLQVAAPTWHSHFTQAGEGFFRPSAQEPPKQSGPSLRERVKARQERKLRMWQAKQRAAEEEKSAARALEVAIEGAAVETKRAEAKEEGSVAHSVSETSPSVSRAQADEWNLVSSGGELLSESEAESRVNPERSRPTPPRKHVSRLVDPEAARRIAAQRPPQISAEDSAFLKEVAEQWYCRMDRRIRGNLRRLEDPTLLQSLEGLVHSYKSMAACPHEAVGLARSEFGRDGCSHSVNVCLPHDPLFKRKRGASFDSDFLVIDSDSEDEEQVLKFDVIAHDDAEWQEWSRANRCSCRVESGPTASAALLWPPAPLYLAIEDSWARMLLHGLCQFHGLISKSFTSRTGLRLTCVHHPRGLQQSGLTVAAEANAWPAHLPVPKLVSHLETRRQQRF